MKNFFNLITLAALVFISSNLFSQAPPRAYDVSIQGVFNVNTVLTGIYSYADTNNRPEGISLYQWYRADSINQPVPVAIDSATRITYTTDSIDHNKFLAFEVIPVASGTGDSVTGLPVRVWTDRVVSYVGIRERTADVMVYPNPAESSITIKTISEIRSAEFITSDGRLVKKMNNPETLNMDVTFLPKGIYLLRVTFSDDKRGYARFVKL